MLKVTMLPINTLIRATIGWALILLSASVYALPEDSQQPIHISSNSAIKDDKQGLTIYEGDVTMTQGSLKIEAEKITIYSNTDQVTKIIASGKPARFKQQPKADQGDVLASANTIEYRLLKKAITLTENASLHQDGSTITGNSISYDIDAARIEAGSTGDKSGDNIRVNVVIPPPSSKPN